MNIDTKLSLVKHVLTLIKKDYKSDKCIGYAPGCPNCQGQILQGSLEEYYDLLKWEKEGFIQQNAKKMAKEKKL